MPDEWIAAHYGWGEPMESQPYEPESEQESWSPSEASGIGILEKDGTVVAIGDHGPPPLVTEEPESSIDLPGGTLHSAPEAEPKAKARGKCGGKGCGRSKGSTIPRPRRCRWTCLKGLAWKGPMRIPDYPAKRRGDRHVPILHVPYTCACYLPEAVIARGK